MANSKYIPVQFSNIGTYSTTDFVLKHYSNEAIEQAFKEMQERYYQNLLANKTLNHPTRPWSGKPYQPEVEVVDDYSDIVEI